MTHNEQSTMRGKLNLNNVSPLIHKSDVIK